MSATATPTTATRAVAQVSSGAKHTVKKLGTGSRGLAALVLAAACVGGFAALAPRAEAATVDASDTFSRANQAGWGRAATGGSYTLAGQQSAFAVASSRGVLNGLTPGKTADAWLSGVSLTDVVVSDTVAVTAGDLNSINLLHSLVIRRQSSGDSYRGQVRITKSGALALSVTRVTGGTETALGTAVTLPFAVKKSQDLNLQVEATGSTTVTVKVRAWLASSSVPAWQLTRTDTSASRIIRTGAVGVRDALASSVPAAVSVAHDNLTVTKTATAAPTTTSTTSTAPTTTTGSTTAAPTTTSAPATATAPATSGSIVTSGSTAPAVSPAGSTTATAPTVTLSPATGVLLDGIFDGLSTGPATTSGLVADLGALDALSDLGALTVVADDRGGNALRANLVADGVTGLVGSLTGAALPLPSVDKACLQYDVKFGAGTNWASAGSLLKLEGTTGLTGAAWSGSLGWNGAATAAGNIGATRVVQPNLLGSTAQTATLTRSFAADTWHTVRQCYTLNTPGVADGSVKSWIDGAPVGTLTGVTFRTSSDVKVNRLVIAPSGNGTGAVDIDNIVVTAA
jgi:hypothetical protein